MLVTPQRMVQPFNYVLRMILVSLQPLLVERLRQLQLHGLAQQLRPDMLIFMPVTLPTLMLEIYIAVQVFHLLNGQVVPQPKHTHSHLIMNMLVFVHKAVLSTSIVSNLAGADPEDQLQHQHQIQCIQHQLVLVETMHSLLVVHLN